MNWILKDEKQAPKDGTMILAMFNCYPTPVSAVWSGCDENWACAVPNVGPVEGIWDDWYFETERFSDDDLHCWRKIP